MLRVALVIDTHRMAGTERHMLDLATALQGQNCRVSLVAPSGSALLQAADVRSVSTRSFDPSPGVNLRLVSLLLKALKRGEFDVLHAHNGGTALACALAVKLAGRGTCVISQHFISPRHLSHSGIRRHLHRLMHHAVARGAKRFIAVSQAVRDAMIARGDAASGQIGTVLNGVSDPTESCQRHRSETRCMLGVAPEAQLVVCVARLEPEKDAMTLLRAIAEVRKSIPSVRCVIAGEGKQRPVLQTAIHELGLQQTVQLLGFRDDVPDVIQAGDVFVLPSPAEPFGLVLVEAMALGKPVIAARDGGPREIVQEGVTGRLFKPGSVEDLASALGEMLRAPQTASTMGQAARQRYLERFTAERMARETATVYEAALKPNAAS